MIQRNGMGHSVSFWPMNRPQLILSLLYMRKEVSLSLDLKAVQVTVRESILLLPLSPLTGLLSSFVVIRWWTETPRNGCRHHVRRSGLVRPRIRGTVRR
jgi:hypothetical protein